MSIVRRKNLDYNRGRPKIAFDEASGQQYTEVLSRAVSMRADWVWKSTGSVPDPSSYISKGPGCESLLNMTMRTVLKHLSEIHNDTLEPLPWEIGRLIWKRVRKNQLDSLHVWKAFAGAYSGRVEDESLRYRRQVIERPDMDFSVYIKHVTSTSYQWITHLNLVNFNFERRDLMDLAKLINLGALTVESTSSRLIDSCVDDNIIQAWARAALEVGAFSMLRVLACSFQLLTSTTFGYLSQFPVLSIFLLINKAPHLHLKNTIKAKAEAHKSDWKFKQDWEIEVNEGKNPLNLCNNSWELFIHEMFHYGGYFGVASISKEGVEAINRLPELQFSLGCKGSKIKIDSSLEIYERTFSSRKTFNGNDLIQKRRIEEPNGGQGTKKRIMRVSRTGNISDTLTDFLS